MSLWTDLPPGPRIRTNIRFAYDVMRGQLEIEDVPENRQTWVRWFVERHGPARPIPDEAELGVWLLSRTVGRRPE